MIHDNKRDLETTQSELVWSKLHHDSLGTPQDKLFKHYDHIGRVQYPIIRKYTKSTKGRLLEIGCGTAMTALNAYKDGWDVYGVDFSKPNLLQAQKYFKHHHARIRLNLGDIHNLPYKSGFFDLIYGGGVIEHTYDTQLAVGELYRVLKPGGVSVNTVPAFSLSALTYRQLAGNIPDMFIFKNLFTYIHINLLKRKLMHCGYEKSFTVKKIKDLHRQAGFSKVAVTRLNSFQPEFPNIPNSLKPYLARLEKHRLFWAWLEIHAIK